MLVEKDCKFLDTDIAYRLKSEVNGTERFAFDMSLIRVLSEAQFLAGEDARGALVVLEPETELSDGHLDALLDCGAAGFISDYTPERFEKPDEVPVLVYDKVRFANLRAFAVTPRIGVRLRTYASGNPICHVDVDEKGVLSLVPPAATVKRDKSNDPSIDKSEILEAFKRLGVKRGDTLMVHSSLSACGHIVGGAKTVIESLIEAVGEDGHFFFPSFQRSECFLNGAISRRWDHRPADVNRRDSASVLWVGSIPLAFMQLYPDAPRGEQISHSWTGWGKRAAEMLSLQKWNDPPFGESSLPRQVLKAGGKILHFGSTIARTSFLHCLEDHFKLPGYSAPGFYQVRQSDGEIAWVGLTGCYAGSRISTIENENAPLYREAIAEGLRIDKTQLGVGTLMLMDCRNYWDILAKVFVRNPSINLGRAY